MKRELRYQVPAEKWLEALPIGNGSFGGMIYGGIDEETIALNEESFWAGYPRNLNRKDAGLYMEKIRTCIGKGRYKDAQNLIEKHMLSTFNQPYQPLGSLKIRFIQQGEVKKYERKLNLACGVVETTYEIAGTIYKREYFCSYPDQVMVIRLVSQGIRKLCCEVSLDSMCRHVCGGRDGAIVMDVTAPSEVKIEDVYRFPSDSEIIYDDSRPTIKGQVMMRAVMVDGLAKIQGDTLQIIDSSECYLLLTASTTYKTTEVGKKNQRCLAAAAGIAHKDSMELLRVRHITDVKEIMGRVDLELCQAKENSQPRETSDISRESAEQTELLFDFGRYLLLSSSRKGTLPANLQGIWNEKCIPPWWSNWTMNINLEMNYWMACRANMAECVEPLLEFTERLAVNGRETARQHYGCRGWVSHHMTDIWMNTSPVGYEGKVMVDSASWAMWPMSGVWLCLYMWEYYEYSGNFTYFQQKAYPVIKGCLEFLMDWMVYRDGYYRTEPSTSPENMYLAEGEICAICSSSAMDMEMIREFMEMVQKAMELVGESEEWKERIKGYLGQLSGITTGQDGEILEWGSALEETEPGHRHFSHLFSLYPGHQFMKPENRDLKRAAEISLERRMENGGGGTGWSRVWAICLWARLGRGDKALESIKIFQKEDIFTNLFGFCPPEYFQIDCNLGFPAAIMEMLLQEENGILYPLPALPKEWKYGHIYGLVCRGGHIVDLEWGRNRISFIRFTAKHTGIVKVKIPTDIEKVENCKHQVHLDKEVLELKHTKDTIYEIRFTDSMIMIN